MNASTSAPRNLANIHQGCAFIELLLRAIRRFGDRPALVFDDQTMTYRQIGDRISQYAQALKSLGLVRGDGVAQLSSNRPEVLLVNAASWLLGARVTLLHPMGSREDQAFKLNDSECRYLLLDERKYQHDGAYYRAEVPAIAHIMGYGGGAHPSLNELADQFQPRPLVSGQSPDDIVGISYTGGTTGKPKGVVSRSRGRVELAHVCVAAWEWPEEVRLLAATPISHAAGTKFMPTMIKGGTFYLLDGFHPESFLQAIEKHRITMASLVPTMLYVLLDHPALKKYDASSLKVMLYGASPMIPARLSEGIAHFGQIFLQFYGQAEAPMVVTTLSRAEHDLSRPERLASCGRASVNVELKLLDDQDNEVPVGNVGEICVRGPLVTDGYWKRPKETAETFRNGWLRTGDLARMDEEGFCYIVDRNKDVIISGGFNVYPREVEDVLSQHPSVLSAAVIGVPDPKWGESVRAIVVRRADAADIGEHELIAWVRDKKGPVSAPKAIEFASAIPMTGLGKPDKKALRAKYWGGRERQVG